MNDLNAALLDAHEAGDKARLVALYRQAAEDAHSEAACGFYLTHAYVFALEIGHPDTAALRERLVVMGRETPL